VTQSLRVTLGLHGAWLTESIEPVVTRHVLGWSTVQASLCCSFLQVSTVAKSRGEWQSHIKSEGIEAELKQKAKNG
jgi:hypothetical protein